jgi:hypothetical protein
MTIKLIYIIIFFAIDLVIWLVLNRPVLFGKKARYALAVLFALFIILHMGVVRSALLLPWHAFFNLVVVTCAPVMFYAWYTGLLQRRRSRNVTETKLSTGLISVANVLFIYLVHIAAVVIQVVMIIGYTPDKM